MEDYLIFRYVSSVLIPASWEFQTISKSILNRGDDPTWRTCFEVSQYREVQWTNQINQQHEHIHWWGIGEFRLLTAKW
jgi:hypothetical protein